MQKIMFNDKYCLTAAVIAGNKVQTRRVINATPKAPKTAYGLEEEAGYVHLLDGYTVVAKSRFKVGEVVAVAQPYSYLDGKSDKFLNEWCGAVACDGMNGTGYNNKMFVKAKLMPHRIEITNIRVERLQDISEIDCIAEGIYDLEPYGIRPKFTADNLGEVFFTEKEAYAALIDKISGKGTWERNPYVFVYNFKLVK